MKKNLLTLLIVWLIGWIWYYFLTKWPTRSEIVFAGNYQSFESMSGTIDSDSITVLNFYAPRCPSCRTAHKNILNEVNTLPTNLQILNIDYDTHKDLRTKYWVTSQHTFVLIDRNGNKLKSIQWLNHVSEIISFVWSDILNPLPTIQTGEIQTWDLQIDTLVPSDTSIRTTNTTLPWDTTLKKQNITTENTTKQPAPQAKQSVGIYTDYESGKKYISDSTKNVVLFFHASRCPSCKQAEKSIVENKNTIDSDLVILKVDYDDSTELKTKYWITSQTSYVLVNSNGTLNKKSVGMTSLSDIEKFVQ